jgi:hypothetical protein
MKKILDELARAQKFIPTTSDEFLALQFAKRLGDELAIGRYLQYVSRHPIPYLMRRFHRARRTDNPARTFHSSLSTSTP